MMPKVLGASSPVDRQSSHLVPLSPAHCLLLRSAGDAVGAWFGDKLAAVLFPTADTRKQLQQLAERSPNPPDLIIIANPQWELEVCLNTPMTLCGLSVAPQFQVLP